MAERPKYFSCTHAFSEKSPVSIGGMDCYRVRYTCPRRQSFGKQYILPPGGMAACQSCEKYKNWAVNDDG